MSYITIKMPPALVKAQELLAVQAKARRTDTIALMVSRGASEDRATLVYDTMIENMRIAQNEAFPEMLFGVSVP